MDERTAIAWLHRRVGFGLAPGELDRAVKVGVDGTVERLLRPDRAGVPAAPDPWAGLELSARPDRAQATAALGRWLAHLVATPRPLEDWTVWFWHGHFATSLAKVKVPALMVRQLRTFRSLGRGRFAPLLRAITVDPAMLIWLDGGESTGTEPNENFGREVLELFALGLGGYGEADVAAGAKALTGWQVRRRIGESRFVPARHDDTPRRYLGRDGVHDVDTVVAAITAHPDCARFLAATAATAVLGDAADAGLVADLARRFATADLDVSVLLAAVLEAGLARLDGPAERRAPVVLAPVPWLTGVLRATGARLPPKESGALLKAAGQLPMLPPNVGGWPGGRAWLGSSTVVARYDLAGLVAQASAPGNPARAAAAAGDDAALADALGRPEGFSATTRTALGHAATAGGAPGVARLALALASPDLALA